MFSAVGRTVADYIGLFVNERGLDRALAAGVDGVNVVVVATETFSERSQGVPITGAARSSGAISGRARAGDLPGDLSPERAS